MHLQVEPLIVDSVLRSRMEVKRYSLEAFSSVENISCQL
jgi:hypothetical protein